MICEITNSDEAVTELGILRKCIYDPVFFIDTFLFELTDEQREHVKAVADGGSIVDKRQSGKTLILLALLYWFNMTKQGGYNCAFFSLNNGCLKHAMQTVDSWHNKIMSQTRDVFPTMCVSRVASEIRLGENRISFLGYDAVPNQQGKKFTGLLCLDNVDIARRGPIEQLLQRNVAHNADVLIISTSLPRVVA